MTLEEVVLYVVLPLVEYILVAMMFLIVSSCLGSQRMMKEEKGLFFLNMVEADIYYTTSAFIAKFITKFW